MLRVCRLSMVSKVFKGPAGAPVVKGPPVVQVLPIIAGPAEGPPVVKGLVVVKVPPVLKGPPVVKVHWLPSPQVVWILIGDGKQVSIFQGADSTRVQQGKCF